MSGLRSVGRADGRTYSCPGRSATTVNPGGRDSLRWLQRIMLAVESAVLHGSLTVAQDVSNGLLVLLPNLAADGAEV